MFSLVGIVQRWYLVPPLYHVQMVTVCFFLLSWPLLLSVRAQAQTGAAFGEFCGFSAIKIFQRLWSSVVILLMNVKAKRVKVVTAVSSCPGCSPQCLSLGKGPFCLFVMCD